MNTFYPPQFLTITKAVPTVLWGLMVAGSIAPAIAQLTVYPMTTTNTGYMNLNQTLKVTGKLDVVQETTFGKNVFLAKKIFLETFKDLPSQNPSKDYFAIIDGATGQLKRGAEITGPGGGSNNTVGSGGVANGLGNTPLVGTFWTIGGNTISATTTGINTLTTNDYFGIKNFAPLIFVTNNIPRVWISETGNVGVGKDNPVEKLEVEGNVRISGTTTSSVVRTARIRSSDTSGIISLGDSTLYLEPTFHRIFTSANSSAGITIGNPRLPASTGIPFIDFITGITQFATQSALAPNSTAIGYNLRISPSAENAMVLGSGYAGGYLENNKANSLMVGFNSDKPTLYVGTSDGINTSGNVGVGTSSPGTKLHVESSDPATTIQSSTPVLYLRNASTTKDALTSISFRGSTTTGLSYPTAQIGTINTPGSGVASGEIYFATTKLNGALAEAMRIISGGNIGVGTATPNQLVELRNAESTTRLRITNDAGPANGGLEFYAGASFKGGFLFNGGGKVMSFYGPSGASGVINMHDNGDIVFNQGSTAAEWVRIKEGKVGIGTTNPLTKLHVENNGNVRITLKDASNPTGRFFQIEQDKDLVSFNDDGVKQIMSMNLTTGNVGIGTTCPLYKLDVKGLIRANEFIVEDFTGCDFVFDNSYHLRPMKQRKAATLIQKHLFNIAPASLMRAAGASLGELSHGILQNLEEHELYLYEHDEKIEKHDGTILLLIEENKELKKENAQLKKQYKMLDNRLKKLEN